MPIKSSYLAVLLHSGSYIAMFETWRLFVSPVTVMYRIKGFLCKFWCYSHTLLNDALLPV